MIEIGRRRRTQAPPPHVVFAALVDPPAEPHRPEQAPWLELLADEVVPRVLRAQEPQLVEWSSLWIRRPDVLVRFELAWDAGHQGTELIWSVRVSEPVPSVSLVGHLRYRMNTLINGCLRAAFG